ncbi:hypothetical protein GPZ88_01060 [Streptococcus ruminicola]|uniref:Uncharacterized protein n=1 Tax=Streptococcus ruminicola TaxID=2686210 RepID=A0A6G8HXY8_9STRE|nr:hypothetical protein [Streptococcus ruminicola]QIM45729.1 hypothetical protein GPZ88_01060 [Streptococcus ruminicola]
MGIIAAGQITVVDLSDAPVLNAFITANKPTTQVYSQTSGGYNPSYASSAQTLTLNLTKAGSTATILNNTGKVRWYVVDGATKTEITSTTNTDNQYLSGSHNENLTTKVNVDANKGSRRYEASGTWKDPVTGLDVQFQAQIDLFVTSVGKETQILNVYAGNGSTFRNNLPASLTVNADLYRGNVLTNDNKQFKFFYQDTTVTSDKAPGYDADGGIGWHLCSSTTAGQTPNVAPGTNTTGQGVLTVTPAVVINAQTFKVVCINKTGGLNNQKTTGLCTIVDMSDPISLHLESSAGYIFKNGQGSTVMKARLFRNGEELDADGSDKTKTYKWAKYDKNGVMSTNFGGSGNAYKTGKSITVSASEVSAKADFKCEVWE